MLKLLQKKLMADEDQGDLLVEILNFKKNAKPKSPAKKLQKGNVLKNLYNLFEGRERVINFFGSKIFPITTKDTGFTGHSNLKTLTAKRCLPWQLPIALVQVKAGWLIRKLIKWNQRNNIFFVLSKRNYQRNI